MSFSWSLMPLFSSSTASFDPLASLAELELALPDLVPEVPEGSRLRKSFLNHTSLPDKKALILPPASFKDLGDIDKTMNVPEAPTIISPMYRRPKNDG